VAPRHRRYGAKVLGLLGAVATAQAARAALTELAASRWGATYPSVVERWRAAVEELEPFYALMPRLQCIVRSGDEAVQRLQRSLGLAVARQGSFAGQTDVTSFMVGALERAERNLVERATVREACIEHRAGSANRASSRSRVEALGL
jgi:transposase-like protein